ncbi:hypothetical protein PCASD_06804 [Puccinia coronata f. sp. avenae]|uniref:Kinesin motor domain-containing protein n=1 Tax=Puccinia coronata f. sp. avenae TaxID=200324 RepID=A0A2N5UQE7_9BASI|nr:hypothetical protein PCASD_06804 [Puccinia coronata f. sp. avenae]
MCHANVAFLCYSVRSIHHHPVTKITASGMSRMLEPIDARDFERRPATPVRSRLSPEKKPICSGLFTSSTATPIPTSGTVSTPPPLKNNSTSKFTPTKKQQQLTTNINTNTPARIQPLSSLSSAPTTPTQSRTLLTRTELNATRSPQFIGLPPPSLNSPLRASLTAEAIPRKKSLLPGAPNPLHHTRLRSLKSSSSPFSSPFSPTNQSTPTLFDQSPSQLPKSQSHSISLSQSPALLRPSQSLSQLSPLTQSHSQELYQAAPIEEPPIGKAQLENVLVAIRLKGLVDHHVESPKISWSINSDGTQISELYPQHALGSMQSNNSSTSGTTWSFDSVFGQSATNEDVYQRSGARDLILSAMAGYDATIFAYGQTASGKTHTLTGSAQQPGIIPLSVQEIFTFIRSHPEREFLLRVSYLEVYNEQIHDLLIPTTQSAPPPVRIRQQTNGMFFADPVREEVVTNVGQVAALISRGERQRHVAGTDWNARSSRSHTIFGIVVESRLYGLNGGVRRSKVCLIDLAGNERASSEVERRSEGSFINKSLLTLEKVISGLAEPVGQSKRRSQHIPYRDSKLTQILQPSLSGKSRVCVICTMNWTYQSVEDSRSTLRFASRVKKIQTSAGVNEILSDSALMVRYRQQIVELQAQLKEAVNRANQPNENVNHYQHSPHASTSIILADQSQIEKAEEERSKIKKQLKELQSIILNAENLDQVESTSKETRPVSPVKKHSNPAWLSESSHSDSDDDSVGREDVTKTAREHKSMREKELEAKIELQDYEIACLRLELIGFKYKKAKRHKSILEPVKQEEHDNDDQENDGKMQDHEVEDAVKRVAESRESIENRLTDMALEIKQRKQFTQEVMDLLDASRAKTHKLELLILNEIKKSTRRLSKIERTAYVENTSNPGAHNKNAGKGRTSRRRSSSINSNPYEILLSNGSTLGHSSAYPNHHQNKLMTKLKNNLNLHSSAQDESDEPLRGIQDGHLGRRDVDRSHENHPGGQPDADTDDDDEELSTLLSIVNEMPELECIRMSFGEGMGAAGVRSISQDPHRLHYSIITSTTTQQQQHPYESISMSQLPRLPPHGHHQDDQLSRAPQDRFGILPNVLLQSRRVNASQQTLSTRRLELLWCYLADWIVVLLMALLFGLLDRVHGHHREFDLNDATIQFSYATTERIPVPLLAVLSVLIPAVLIILFSQLVLRSGWDTHIGLLGLTLSLSLSLVVTTVVKITVGRPRPDMLSRCIPALSAENAGAPSYGLSNSSICTAPSDSRKFQDGFRSFPSGHSSTAWAGLAFLSLYLAGKLHLFDRRGHSLKVWISIFPLLGATLIAISRTMDNRHHWQDVLVGSALGVLTAWFAYRFYYPSLYSQNSHRPYSPRISSSTSPSGEDDDDSVHSRSSFAGDVENQLMQPHTNSVSLPLSQIQQSPKPERLGTTSILSHYSSPIDPQNQPLPKVQ